MVEGEWRRKNASDLCYYNAACGAPELRCNSKVMLD